MYIFEICISWTKYKLSAGRMPGCCKSLMVILSDLKLPFYNNFFDSE